MDERGFKVTYTGQQVQDLLDDVNEASPLTNMEIEELLNNADNF
jgi:hypothetical protein